ARPLPWSGASSTAPPAPRSGRARRTIATTGNSGPASKQLGGQHVALPPDGTQQLRTATGPAQLAAQVAHVQIQRPVMTAEAAAEDGLVQIGLAEHLVTVLAEGIEQAEFGFGEGQRVAGEVGGFVFMMQRQDAILVAGQQFRDRKSVV